MRWALFLEPLRSLQHDRDLVFISLICVGIAGCGIVIAFGIFMANRRTQFLCFVYKKSLPLSLSLSQLT